MELLTDQISTDMIAEVTRKVLDTVNYEHIAQYAGMNLDYSRVVDYARGGIISSLLNDERFSSRLMRLVGDATVGVTNEAVERVSAIMESKSNNNSDL